MAGLRAGPEGMQERVQSALHLQPEALFRDLLAANIDGSLTRRIRHLGRLDLLVIDDGGMEVARRSQYPPENWHEVIRDPTVGDAIVDRLIHRAYRIDLVGDTLRNLTPQQDSEEA